MKSRCMSMITSAVDDQSRSIGSGSAATVPTSDFLEFAMTTRPPRRKNSQQSVKQAPCHCVQRGRALPRSQISHVFSRLYFEGASAYSLCEDFVTSICLFVERRVRRAH